MDETKISRVIRIRKKGETNIKYEIIKIQAQSDIKRKKNEEYRPEGRWVGSWVGSSVCRSVRKISH